MSVIAAVSYYCILLLLQAKTSFERQHEAATDPTGDGMGDGAGGGAKPVVTYGMLGPIRNICNMLFPGSFCRPRTICGASNTGKRQIGMRTP